MKSFICYDNWSVIQFVDLSFLFSDYDFYNTPELEVARWIHIILRPVLIIFGTVGNVLSFWVLMGSSLRKISTCFYLSILAISDTGWYNAFFFQNIREVFFRNSTPGRSDKSTGRLQFIYFSLIIYLSKCFLHKIVYFIALNKY